MQRGLQPRIYFYRNVISEIINTSYTMSRQAEPATVSFLSLPTELRLCIFEECTAFTLLRVSQTCTTLRAELNSLPSLLAQSYGYTPYTGTCTKGNEKSILTIANISKILTPIEAIQYAILTYKTKISGLHNIWSIPQLRLSPKCSRFDNTLCSNCVDSSWIKVTYGCPSHPKGQCTARCLSYTGRDVDFMRKWENATSSSSTTGPQPGLQVPVLKGVGRNKLITGLDIACWCDSGLTEKIYAQVLAGEKVVLI
ncbi:hypothetical protein BJ508DRAFT_38405 [Ascobolus immersus RN42]|uniref:F-box domain-containing protein n=1 Tax=Ascobolus immersus RN42 TaxID=1160509 RepID=A0A3N4IE70_ASCIM|nr:hypothetical protein BJ508DRAFT_38405 [Ascobolus immersus RN42]